MKYIQKILLLAVAVAALFTACKKVDELPLYNEGTAPTLTASATTVAPAPADSNNVALRLNWTSPKYSIDTNNYKFTVEIDSATKNFSRSDTKVVMGGSSTTFTAKELNNFLLARGYAFNTPVDMDVRVISSYANNNERLTSNVVRIKMTPYKIPPKVALPASGKLFIVGDATTFGWSNDPAPAFPPAREFARIDETTWGGIFYLDGSGAYKILQTQGNWDTQFHMVTGGSASAGSFVQENADPGFPSPATAGWYKIMLDFQTGKYTVESFGNDLPQELYITGDATTGGWSNTPPAAQKFTRLNSVEYELQPNITFAPGKFYKFLSSSGNWQPQFGGSSATGGTLGANYGSSGDPDAIPTPAAGGSYKVKVNFYTNRYSVTP